MTSTITGFLIFLSFVLAVGEVLSDIASVLRGQCMTDHSFSTDLAAEAVKGAPPVAVTVSTLAGIIDWQTWVLILTAIYVAMQIGWLGWKYLDKWSGRKGCDHEG